MPPRLLLLVVTLALARLASAQPAPCTTHWDCAQGEFCYGGSCLRDAEQDVYHCGKAGCPPGERCVTPTGTTSRCAEDEAYACATACDCGPAHGCIEIEGVGKRCVKDVDDAWLPGGTAIFGATIPPGEPTYCCAKPDCFGGYALADPATFSCHDRFTGSASPACGGRKCFFAGDCDLGQSCADVYSGLAIPGGLCTESAGRCVSNAVAEAVLGYPPSALLSACAFATAAGQSCEAGWTQGGAFVASRVVAQSGSCGDGTCQAWESHRTCPADCADCSSGGPDGTCEPEEQVLGTCAQDCGTCGDGTCNGLETPKLCPADCPVTCGDQSCDPSETATCPQDCPCPVSASLGDRPSFCGDGFCDLDPVSRERCETCPADCPGAPERCNVVDDDCDGDVDEGAYRIDGFGPPLRLDGAVTFRVGSTIPVKVVVVDCAGAVVPDASVLLELTPPVGDATRIARYDASAGQYVFNLSTRAFPRSTYRISAVLENGDRATAEFTLR